MCPVDGAISQFGAHRAATRSSRPRATTTRTTALVGGDAALAARFDDGHFATLYLSPRDYHRIHMPCAGRLTRMIHVPGELFSVNPTTARGVPGLFARNERVVCVFDGDARPLRAGAGGRHHRRQHGHRLARRGQPAARRARCANGATTTRTIELAQGDEMGRFLLGSTVVMLFPQGGRCSFNPAWAPGGAIRMGEPMARRWVIRAGGPART